MLRRLAAGALTVTATGLRVGARTASAVARLIRPPARPSARLSGPPPPQEVPRPPQVGRVVTPPSARVPDQPSHTRAPETHVAELAAKPAADVIAAVTELSTDELGRLYEYESANRKRKTVLQAIERQAAPTPS